MKTTQKISLDFAQWGITQRIAAVQGDSYTRVVEVSMYENKEPWDMPVGSSAFLRFRKPDGTGGMYDTLPDGTQAWSAQDHVVCFTLAPQVLTVPGAVQAQLEIVRGDACLASFTFLIEVAADPSAGVLDSEDYVSWNAWALQSLENLFFVGSKSPGVKPALWFDTSQGNSRTQITVIDKDGNKHLPYPITKMACVDGLEDALASIFKNKTTNGDFDKLTTPGWAWCQLSVCTNGPTASGFGFLEVVCPSDYTILQRFTNYSKLTTYIRSYVNSAWNDWTRVDAGAVSIESLGITATALIARGNYTGDIDTVDDSDGLHVNSVVWVNANTVNLPYSGFGWLETWGTGTGSLIQRLTYTTGVSCRRVRYNDGSGVEWYAWKWETTPNASNVEYLTTARWDGYGVYTKRVKLGAVTNGTQVNANLDGAKRVLRYQGTVDGYPLPFTPGMGGGPHDAWIAVDNVGVITVYTNESDSMTVDVQLWYVKG